MTNYKKKADPVVQDPFLLGQMQPKAIELECAVLGAIMIDRDAFEIVADLITDKSFYNEAHQYIYRAISRLASKFLPIDILTVTEELIRLGQLDEAGGAHYIVDLSNRVASAANIEYHARIIQQKHIRREMIRAGMNAVKYGYDETQDVFDDLSALESEVFKIASGSFSVVSVGAGPIALDVLKLAEKAIQQKGLTGVAGGLKPVDRQTGGWQPTDLVIVAARPGMGKTAFVTGQAVYAAKHQNPVLVFSLEMSKEQIVQRIISQEANVDVQSIRTGKISQQELDGLKNAADKIQGLQLYIDDTPAITLSALRTKCRKAVSKQGVKMVVVDYLQLMGTDNREGQNREQQIGQLARGLKALAKELNVPIIALSQLSRAVETRGGSKRPMLSDLRESGSIEQDADAVVFLYRAEYYGIMEDEKGASLKGTAEVIFAKHRNGATGTCDPVGFKDKTAEFFNLDEPQYLTVVPDFSPTSIPKNARPQNDEDIPF